MTRWRNALWAWRVLILALCWGPCGGTLAAEASKPYVRDFDATQHIEWALHGKDCQGAVKRLNEALAQGNADVLFFAGAMFEDGICVRQDWQRAMGYYVRADNAGHPFAAHRLAAGWLMPSAGRDLASTLWWARRARQAQPKDCVVVATGGADDPEVFVKVLQSWPSGRVAACAYVAGVLTTLVGDLQYPVRMSGAPGLGSFVIDVSYWPAAGVVSLKPGIAGFSEPVEVSEAPDWKAKDVGEDGFLAEAQARARYALKRYTKPAGIDPAWVARVQVVFRQDN